MPNIQSSEVKRKDIPGCTHSSLSKEYYLGSATGDYVCDKCGKSGFGRNWPNNDKAPAK